MILITVAVAAATSMLSTEVLLMRVITILSDKIKSTGAAQVGLIALKSIDAGNANAYKSTEKRLSKKDTTFSRDIYLQDGWNI